LLRWFLKSGGAPPLRRVVAGDGANMNYRFKLSQVPKVHIFFFMSKWGFGLGFTENQRFAILASEYWMHVQF
jgi:hypothetical protein